MTRIESLSDEDDRSAAECGLLKIHLRELRSEFARLSKIEDAAARIARQTNAECAYALHDDLIAALEVQSRTKNVKKHQ